MGVPRVLVSSPHCRRPAYCPKLGEVFAACDIFSFRARAYGNAPRREASESGRPKTWSLLRRLDGEIELREPVWTLRGLTKWIR